MSLDKDGTNKLNISQYIPVFTSLVLKHLSSNIIKDILQIIEKESPDRRLPRKLSSLKVNNVYCGGAEYQHNTTVRQ